MCSKKDKPITQGRRYRRGASKDSGHKDVIIEANLTCGHPDKITAFDFGPAFERFDDLEKIEVEGVAGDRSLSDSLTRERVKTSI